jgi:hypothetical protein
VKPWLSYELVLTSWWAHPNCNLVLNCVDSPRRSLRQQLQDGKHIFSSEVAKRSLCNIHQNGWCITRGTQQKRRFLHLESRGYNKSSRGPKLSASSRLIIENLPCLFQSPTWLSSVMLHIIHSWPSVFLDSRLSLSHIILVLQAPSYNLFVLLVLVYHRFRAGTLHDIGPLLSHVVLISHMTSRTLLSIYLSDVITAWHWNRKVFFFLGIQSIR